MRPACLAWTALEPADRGYRVRTRAILKHLPADEILVLSPPPELEGIRHIALSRPWPTRLPLPFNSDVLLFQGKTKAYREALRALADFRPDVVWCEGLWAFPPAHEYRRKTGTPIVLDVQNIEYVAAMRGGSLTLKSSLLRKQEERTYPSCDFLVACSATDSRNLHGLFSISRRKILVLPNGVEPFEEPDNEERVYLRQSAKEKVVLFLGKLDYRPNREAVAWMFKSLLPELREIPHRLCLAIVGGPVPSRLPERLPPNVRLHLPGRVERIEAYLQAADVCLAPIFSGSGTRIKILEFLAAGKPVVATAKAVEGLDLGPGEHFELAEDANQTAAAISRLLEDPGEANNMAGRGRALVEELYLWKQLVAEFHEEMKERLAPR